MTTVPEIMSLEYRDMLRRGAELDRLMHAMGWMRGKRFIVSPTGQRFRPDISDQEIRSILAASQLPEFGIKDIPKAA